MDANVRRLVRTRANDRCEYCGLRQEQTPAVTLHVEHIIPKQHGGGDDADNLALACQHCNLHKGPNLSGIDPESGEVVVLFDPRGDTWSDHFETNGPIVAGTSAKGRATVRILDMNAPSRVRLRAVT